MAGILKVDQVQSDSNLAFAIAGSNVAFMNATSLQMVGSNVSLAGTNVFTSGKLVTAAQPIGAVLQVIQAVKTDTFSSSSATFGNVTGLTVSITPTSSSNKILISGVMQTSSLSNDMYKIRIAKNGTAIFVGDTVAGATSALSQFYSYTASNLGNWSTLPVPVYYLDSPATTSAVTYSWQIRTQSDGNTVWVNRTSDQSGNSTQNFYGASSIIVMEIAA